MEANMEVNDIQYKIFDTTDKNFRQIYGFVCTCNDFNCNKLMIPWSCKHIYFTAININKNQIIGLAKLHIGNNDSFCHPGYKNWISYVSVNSNYYGNRIGSKLLAMMFVYLKENNLNVCSSEYTVRGFVHLQPVIEKLAIKYNVDLSDHKIIGFVDWNNFEGFSEKEYREIIDSQGRTKI
jgi:hypothetical protein